MKIRVVRVEVVHWNSNILVFWLVREPYNVFTIALIINAVQDQRPCFYYKLVISVSSITVGSSVSMLKSFAL